MTASVTLPWPHKSLWPNGRAHWASKARETAKHKDWAWKAGMAAKLPCGSSERIPILMIFHPKPKGPAPDQDGCISSCKAYLDGIAKAMGVDDRLFDIQPPIIAERGSKVIIRVGK